MLWHTMNKYVQFFIFRSLYTLICLNLRKNPAQVPYHFLGLRMMALNILYRAASKSQWV